MPEDKPGIITRLREKLMRKGEASPLSRRALFIGLAVVVVIYGAIFGWLALSAKTHLSAIQSEMATKTASIEFKQDVVELAPTRIETITESPTTDSPLQAEEITTPIPTKPNEGPAVVAHPAAPVEVEETTIALAPAPLGGLTEKTPQGEDIPVIRASDQMTAFGAYRRRFNLQTVTKPVVSVVFADIGLSQTLSDPVIKNLPPTVSIILSPYAPSSNQWVNTARAAGHEVWLSLPLEAKDFPRNDTGPLTLLVNAAERDNLMKLNQIMGSAVGYAGFVATPHEIVTESVKDIRPILHTIYKRGLGYVDSRSDTGLNTQAIALSSKAPYASVDIWLDENASSDEVNMALAKVEDIARSKNRAVIVVHPVPTTYKLVKAWIDNLQNKGLVLAPLSAQTGM